MDLLLSAFLTCKEAQIIVTRVLLNQQVSNQVKAELIEVIRQEVPSACELPTEL